MKTFFFFSVAALSSAGAMAQNTALINQQGESREVSVVQQGPGNTSVVNQSAGPAGNRVSISQSGSGNVATITQGSSDSTTGSQNSVHATQSGDGETVIHQSKDGNSISVYQSGGDGPARKRKSSTKSKTN